MGTIVMLTRPTTRRRAAYSSQGAIGSRRAPRGPTKPTQNHGSDPEVLLRM